MQYVVTSAQMAPSLTRADLRALGYARCLAAGVSDDDLSIINQAASFEAQRAAQQRKQEEHEAMQQMKQQEDRVRSEAIQLQAKQLEELQRLRQEVERLRQPR